jgi:hypothetical protein
MSSCTKVIEEITKYLCSNTCPSMDLEADTHRETLQKKQLVVVANSPDFATN